MNVFDWLLDALFPPRKSEVAVRNASADELAQMVSPVTLPVAARLATALLPYRDLAKAAVIEAKYHDNKKAQTLLGEILGEYMLELSSDEAGLSGALALVPVPLSAERLRERGYNQVERVCAAAAARLGDAIVLLPGALVRTRDTAPQTNLSGAERRENIKGAFIPSSDLDTSYTYIVVDDVITTGATMEAAVAALTDVGAAVIPIALAR